MNTKYLLIILSAAISLVSCQKDEDVKPATNPRFSVAYVQNIDARGVEFAANVFELGSEEVLEYGFVFSRNPNPKIETADIVSETGKPENVFKLTADYAMQEGMEYFVAAFIKTNRSIVYSEQIKFTSKGSLGFIFESITAPEIVYFGDTITVYGRNFSLVSSNYRVQVMGANAQIHDLSQTSFKIILPPVFAFDELLSDQGLFDIKIGISGKELLVKWPMNFRTASLSTNTEREFGWAESITIKGEYLTSEIVKIRYKNPEGRYFEIPVDYFSSNEIRFKPKAPIEEQSPTLEFTVRGKKMLLENAFRLKPAEINPGQSFIVSTQELITIFGSNFNPEFQKVNKLLTDLPGLYIEIHDLQPDRITLRPANTYFTFLPRKLELFSDTFGVRSLNSATVEYTDPSLGFLNLYPGLDDYENAQGSSSEENTVYGYPQSCQ